MWVMRFPRCSSSGWIRSKASRLPPTMIVNVPSIAPVSPPETGASRNSTLCCARRCAIRRAPAGAIVLMSTTVRPASIAGAICATTCSTSGVSGTIVKTTSAPRTASATSWATVAPSAVRACARAGVRLKTATRWPARSSRRAIGAPIIPVPIQASCIAGYPQPYSFSLIERREQNRTEQALLRAWEFWSSGLLPGVEEAVVDQHLVLIKLRDLPVRQAKVFAQNRLIAFSQKISFDVGPIRPRRKLDRHSGDVELADESIPHPPRGLALAQMRMIGRFVQRQHWSAWHSFLFQRRQCGVARRESGEPILQDLFQRLVVVASRVSIAKTRIGGQFRHSQGLDELGPLMGQDGYIDVLVVAILEDSRRTAARMLRPIALGHCRRTAQRHFGQELMMPVEIGVGDGGVQVLALAGALAMEQRESHRHRRRDAGGDVARGHGQLRGSAVRFADLIGDSGIGLSNIVIAGFVAQRTSLAAYRDRAHDDFRVDLPDYIVTKPQPIDYAGREVLDHHVELRQHRLDQFERARILHVHRQAFLAMVVLEELGTLRRFDVPGIQRLETGGAGAVAEGCKLQLDHLGAHLAQNPAAGGSGHELGNVQHAVTAQHRQRIRHRIILRIHICHKTSEHG